MDGKFWRFAAALLPVCFLNAQQPNLQAPQQASHPEFMQPSPEVLRRAAEAQLRMRAHAIAINDLAAHIQSPDDARRLVDLVAAEFSKELPPKWATRSLRNRIARAEFESAADPGALIPEQRVADAWNDYLEKIGAAPELYVTAAEVHTLRDSYFVTAQVSWARGIQEIWTVPNIYAIGSDGKVANGCRALEAIHILWQLANQPEILQGTRDLIKKGQRLSDMYKNPSQPPAPGSQKSYVTFHIAPPNLVRQAAVRYMNEHGARALNSAIEGLLTDLLTS